MKQKTAIIYDFEACARIIKLKRQLKKLVKPKPEWTPPAA